MIINELYAFTYIIILSYPLNDENLGAGHYFTADKHR